MATAASGSDEDGFQKWKEGINRAGSDCGQGHDVPSATCSCAWPTMASPRCPTTPTYLT